MAVSHARHRFTVDEYHRLGDAGVFPADARIELIDGEVFETLVTMKPPHAAVVRFLTRALSLAVAGRAVVSARLPITLGNASEPEPDLAIVRGPESSYRLRHPGPDDVFAVIEVSEGSLDFDLGTKVPMYAACTFFACRKDRRMGA